MTTETKKEQIVKWLNQLRSEAGTIKDKDLSAKISQMLDGEDFNEYTEADLVEALKKDIIRNGFLSISTDPQSVAKKYKELGIKQEEITDLEGNKAPTTPANTPVATDLNNPLAGIDLTKAGPLAILAGLAGVFFTKGDITAKVKAGAQWAAGAGGGAALLGNTDELGKAFAPLADGGKDLLGGFGDLLGKDGLGSLLSGGGDILSGLVDNPQLQGMFDYFKKNPVTSIGVTAMIAMVGGKLMAGDFAGIFSMIPSLLGVMAMTFFASSFLKMDGQSPQIPYGTQQFAANELPILEGTSLTMNA